MNQIKTKLLLDIIFCENWLYIKQRNVIPIYKMAAIWLSSVDYIIILHYYIILLHYIITLYYSLHIGGFTKPNTLHSVITENNTYTAYDIRKKMPTRRVRRHPV